MKCWQLVLPLWNWVLAQELAPRRQPLEQVLVPVLAQQRLQVQGRVLVLVQALVRGRGQPPQLLALRAQALLRVLSQLLLQPLWVFL
jgi:hypothetical protein